MAVKFALLSNGRHNHVPVGRARIFTLRHPRLSQSTNGNGHGDIAPMPEAPSASLKPEFLEWLRELFLFPGS